VGSISGLYEVAVSARRAFEKCIQNFSRKPLRKEPFERPKRKWKGDNIKVFLHEVGREGED